jgi:hypothetical protein
MDNRTLIVALASALTVSAVLPTTAAAPGGTGNTYEDVDIQLNLTGNAVRTSGGPQDSPSFVYYINATGEGVRRTPQGNGVQVKSDGLDAEVTIVNSATNDTVAQFTARLGFHAQQASAIAQGLPAGNFKFNMGLHGPRSQNVLGSETGSRILAFNANGDTFGPADDDGAHAVAGHGQATLKDAGSHSATHYQLTLGGTASILTQQD